MTKAPFGNCDFKLLWLEVTQFETTDLPKFLVAPILTLVTPGHSWTWLRVGVPYHSTTHTVQPSMARNKSHKSSKALHTSLIAQRKHRNQVVTLIAAAAVRVVTNLVAISIFTTPMNTSKLTGMDWVQELLTGHPVWFSDALAMPKHVYWKLVEELQLYAELTHLKYVLLEEQVAMFLHFCKTRGTVRDLWERFQHSPSTISKYELQLVLQFSPLICIPALFTIFWIWLYCQASIIIMSGFHQLVLPQLG